MGSPSCGVRERGEKVRIWRRGWRPCCTSMAIGLSSSIRQPRGSQVRWRTGQGGGGRHWVRRYRHRCDGAASQADDPVTQCQAFRSVGCDRSGSLRRFTADVSDATSGGAESPLLSAQNCPTGKSVARCQILLSIPSQENIPLKPSANQRHNSARLTQERGGSRSLRTLRWARELRLTSVAEAYGEIVRSSQETTIAIMRLEIHLRLRDRRCRPQHQLALEDR